MTAGDTSRRFLSAQCRCDARNGSLAFLTRSHHHTVVRTAHVDYTGTANRLRTAGTGWDGRRLHAATGRGGTTTLAHLASLTWTCTTATAATPFEPVFPRWRVLRALLRRSPLPAAGGGGRAALAKWRRRPTLTRHLPHATCLCACRKTPCARSTYHMSPSTTTRRAASSRTLPHAALARSASFSTHTHLRAPAPRGYFSMRFALSVDFTRWRVYFTPLPGHVRASAMGRRCRINA